MLPRKSNTGTDVHADLSVRDSITDGSTPTPHNGKDNVHLKMVEQQHKSHHVQYTGLRKRLAPFLLAHPHKERSEYFIMIIVTINAMWIGGAAHHNAVHNLGSKEEPPAYFVIEVVFLMIFLMELGLKLYILRGDMFRRYFGGKQN